MKHLSPILVALILLAGACHAQEITERPSHWTGSGIWPGDPQHLMPFGGLTFLPKTAATAMYPCPVYWYYDDSNPASQTYAEPIPTKRWAVRMSPAEVCTAWTVTLDFDINNASTGERDTLYFFLREVTAPYAQIYQCYYLARPGSNAGEYEISPSPLNTPPASGTQVVNPKRDFYLGVYVKGYPTHEVVWRFKAPITPPFLRSVCFPTPTTIQPASTVLGFDADFLMSARLCHRGVIPVEMESLNAGLEDGSVVLRWKTASELNNLGFEIARASDRNGPWILRGFQPGHGTSMEAHSYVWTDPMTPGEQGGTWCYRLRQLDAEGTYEDFFTQAMEGVVPARFGLQPVHPNPFQTGGAAATITCSIQTDTRVRIDLCDIFGRSLSTVIDDALTAGTHRLAWAPNQGAPLTPGRYFVRMFADGRTAIQPLIINR